jgi:DNA repair exonuclease SbcCD ATPase subunit
MKLISCYIRGFGGLSDYSVTFSEGLNEIYHENGWGKSTFSCFIKSMFYGMEYSPRRKDLMDREHFYPWDADGYGGSLTFCANNKRYRIERSFGKKRSEDRFCLYDDKTGRVSSDYTENIGEELFGVDLESFMKSVYVPQDRPESNMTDSLNAKIGHLETSPDDVNQFDNAMQKLDEARKRYIKTGGQNSGRLVEVRNEIRHARGVAETIPALTDAYSKKQNQLDQRNRELYSCKRDREKLNAAISKRIFHYRQN